MFDPRLLAGRVVLVSGAAGGVGSAAARALHACGATLALTSADATRLQRVCDELRAHGMPADVSRVADCERLVAETLARHGRLDALVHCAGVWTEGESEHVSESDWDRCLDVNLKGAFFLCSRAIPALKATRGAIVTIGSDAGLVGNAGCAAYCASKGGLVMMGKALAMELAPHGVRVNTVCPADIMSPMLLRQAEEHGAGDPQAYLQRLLSRYPQREKRFITPQEVASLVVYLLSDAAAPITGAALGMDFGLTAGY